jgi:3',5'-cyclic-nucleotide phosphodiesterase
MYIRPCRVLPLIEQARKYDVATQWTMILTDEFARQAAMEKDLGIPSALFAPPVRETIELGKSQLGFMNMFAIPLFQGVSDVMPAMAFCVDELHQNKSAWEVKIAEEQAKARQESGDSFMTDGMFSPRSMSLAIPSDASHHKISNATQTLSPDSDLRKVLLSKSPFSPSNGALDENKPRHHSIPELTTSIANESEHPSPSELIPDSSSRRSSKPSQLQLSHATASAPGLVDHPSQDPHLANGISVQSSLVTEAVVAPPAPPRNENENYGERQSGYHGSIYSQDWMSQASMTTTLVKDRDEVGSRRPRSWDRKYATYTQDGDWLSQAAIAATSKMAEMKNKEEIIQRSSDGTEGSTDWTSQVTSATTSKMPLSPSTQGTSIMSQESLEKSTGIYRTLTGEETIEGKGNMVILGMGKMRSLRKKPSRFRMNFWKRSKSASPPMPVQGQGGSVRGIEFGGMGRSDDDGRLSQ